MGKLFWFLNGLLGGIPKQFFFTGVNQFFFFTRNKTKSVLYYTIN